MSSLRWGSEVSGVVSGETRGRGAVLWPIHRPTVGTEGSGTPDSPGVLGRPWPAWHIPVPLHAL